MTLSADLIEELTGMPGELERALRSIPRERLRWLPPTTGGTPGETFSAVSHACHLRDIEIDGYHLRIRRLLEEERPSLVSIDGDALAVERDYLHADLEQALAAFRRARAETVERVRALGDRELERAGDFAEYGQLTLRALLHYLRSHDQQHLAGLHWLKGRMASALIPER